MGYPTASNFVDASIDLTGDADLVLDQAVPDEPREEVLLSNPNDSNSIWVAFAGIVPEANGLGSIELASGQTLIVRTRSAIQALGTEGDHLTCYTRG